MLLFKIVNNGSFGLKYFGLLLLLPQTLLWPPRHGGHSHFDFGMGIPKLSIRRGLSEVRRNTYLGFLSFSNGIFNCAPNYSYALCFLNFDRRLIFLSLIDMLLFI